MKEKPPMNVLSVNDALRGFTDLDLRREVAIRQHNTQEGYKVLNREAARAALTPLLDLAFHHPRNGCDDHHLTPHDKLVTFNQRGRFLQVVCPACYLQHLDLADQQGDEAFNAAWLDNFMVQLQVADYEPRGAEAVEAREEHIGMVLDELNLLLPLTFHPHSGGCDDHNRIGDRDQFRRGENGLNVSCVRCFLLNAEKNPDSWDSRFSFGRTSGTRSRFTSLVRRVLGAGQPAPGLLF
jgi:hypothetical protein